MESPILKIENFSAAFGETGVLKNINLSFSRNTLTAIIGPSGCGKTTFIRCINRMHETIPEARVDGRVRIGEIDAYNGT